LSTKKLEETASQLLTKMESLFRCFTESETEICRNRKITNAESKIIHAITPGGENYVNKIAENLKLSKSRISRLVSSLKRKGLIAKKENDEDHRFNVISLTAKGQELKNIVYKDKLNRCMETLSLVPEKSYTSLLSNLEALKNAFDQYKEHRLKTKTK
jgi:DNA-binding MarR family transcriptional regulator